MKFPSIQVDLRVALWYAIFGSLWIVLSDRLIAIVARDAQALTMMQTYKGWAFVFASAGLIFFLLRHDRLIRQQAEDEIRHLNTTLEQRVEERTNQLLMANKELEAFSYSVSHDLRAPLRAINGFAAILARRYQTNLDADGKHYLDNILQASERMGQLIDGLLKYARLGRSGARLERVPLANTLSNIIQDLRARMEDCGATIRVAENLPVLLGDPTLIHQIFANLLENALTYRRPDVPACLEVTCTMEGDYAVIAVRDNGIGIAEEYQQKIFNIFQRLHSEEEYPGTGIGLSTVQKAANLLGGNVRVESTVGQGSTFFVRLPRKENGE